MGRKCLGMAGYVAGSPRGGPLDGWGWVVTQLVVWPEGPKPKLGLPSESRG